MPPDRRKVIELLIACDFKAPEVAKKLNLSVDTIRSQHFKAIRDFQRMMPELIKKVFTKKEKRVDYELIRYGAKWLDKKYPNGIPLPGPPIEKKRKPIRRVNQYTLDGEFLQSFDGIGEAAKTIGVSSPAFSQYFKRGLKQCGGYKWAYAVP